MTNLKEQIEHCNMLIKNKGVCINLDCHNCPAFYAEHDGCWDAGSEYSKKSGLVVKGALEWLRNNDQSFKE